MNTPHARPAQKRRRIWVRVAEDHIAWFLLMAGVASAGAFLTALGGGYEGWTVVAAIVTVALFLACWLSFRDSARRRAAEPHVIHYHPDSPDVVINTDTDTDTRHLHRD